MLFHIIKEENFEECIEAVRRSLWPFSKNELLLWLKDPPDVRKEKEIKEMIIDKNRSNLKLYKIIGQNTELNMPFIERFHDLFLARGLSKSTKEQIQECDQPLSLSLNKGHFNHFVNVIMALARLIEYFSNIDNLKKHFQNRTHVQYPAKTVPGSQCSSSGYFNNENLEKLVYSDLPNLRTFKLMLAGYYHDLGKTVVQHRHAREGYIILADDSTESIYKIIEIACSYNNEWQFDCDEIHYIATLVNFHDLFGTISTGETGYLRVCNMIDRIKRYSLRYSHEGIDKQVLASQRSLFDLWLLNVADIIVSIEKKGENQTEWKDRDESKKRIEDFFRQEIKKYPSKADCLIHDLAICFRLLEIHNKHHHAADVQKLREKAFIYSRRHSVDRLQRFILEIVKAYLKDYQGEAPDFNRIIQKYILEEMTEEHLNAVIVRSINSLHSLQGFYQDFAWIGHMDYALAFFKKILQRAVGKTQEELDFYESYPSKGSWKKHIEIKELSQILRTGWIRRSYPEQIGDKNFYEKTQAMFFLYNFTSIIVQIIGFILNRESPLDRMRNLEFSDASGERLTEDKLDKIIDLQGPYRTNRSQELILETVYIF